MIVQAVGPTSAPIAFIGEAPGVEEEAKGEPFIGVSGWELANMARDSRIITCDKKDAQAVLRRTCFLSNVCSSRPPENKIDNWIYKNKGQPILKDSSGKPIKNEKGKRQYDPSYVHFRGKWVKAHVQEDCERLYAELRALRPNVVVALGNVPLWALTACRGVGKWRGSTLESDVIPGLKIIPTYHPTAVLRQYDWRYITVQDLRRVRINSTYPEVRTAPYNFLTNPTFEQVSVGLRGLLGLADAAPLKLVLDLEIKRKQIVCLGLAWSKHDALCIPYHHINGKGLHRWTVDEHIELMLLLHQLLRHPNLVLCNQNISFDIQYLFWRFNVWPVAAFDTMIAQNTLFAGAPKKLDYLASMYAEHYVYWKDDGKFWDKPIDYPQLWHYNCLDCCYTFEIWEVQERALKALKLEEQNTFTQNRLFGHVMKMMLRGVLVNDDKKRPLLRELEQFTAALKSEAELLAGVSLLGKKGGFSPAKLADLFYNRLKLPKQFNRKDGKNVLTADDEALKKLSRKEPLIRPLTERISMARSYATAVNAARSATDIDSRWRTAYNLAGTNTYRFSSSENPLDSGLNLQNLTVGKEMIL